jgi:hypothetical protein
MAVSRILPSRSHAAQLRHVRVFGQYEADGDWREIQVDQSGYLKTVIGPGDEAIGAVEIKDHDSGVRADVSATGSPFGNGLHALCYVDPTGRARAASVDAQGRLLLSNVDIQIGAVELKNYDTDMRAEISAPGATFSPALHTMPFMDVTGNAQPGLVDSSGHLQVDVLSSVIPAGAATEATLQQVRDSLAIVEDWDETDRAKVNPIVGRAGVTAGAGATDAGTQRTAANVHDGAGTPALDADPLPVEVGDGVNQLAIALRGVASVANGILKHLEYNAVPPAVADGQMVPAQGTAYGRPIGAAHNLSLGADQSLEVAPWVYDGQANVARASAALGAGYDAAPTPVPTGEAAWALYGIGYTRGAAGGSIRVMVERCLTIGGVDYWHQTTLIQSGVVAAGVDTTSIFQEEEKDFKSTGAAIDYFDLAIPLYRCHKVRISARESSGLAAGTAVIHYKFSN